MTNPEPVNVYLDPETGEIIYLDTDANIGFTGRAGVDIEGA